MQSNFWNTLPKHFLVLAPMEGVTDVIFRQVVAKAGKPDVFFTEFTNVSSYASEAGRNNALSRLKTTSTDHPIVAQIWGKNPEHFAILASRLAKLNFQGIDLNMGCPDRHVNRTGGGAAMIKSPDLAVDCIRQAKSATSLPVSVKTRLGFSKDSEYKTWLPTLLSEDLAALTIHLRTRKEMSKVPAHFELISDILEIKNRVAPHTKLIINGDIIDQNHTKELADKYPGIDGFMIGRGVFQNPFCFTNKKPTQTELFSLLNYHLDLYDAYNSDPQNTDTPRSFEPLKRFFKIYINNFDGASNLRERLMRTKTTTEVRKVLSNF